MSLPVPHGFLEAASTSSNRMLAGRYAVSEHTVCRWRRKCGIQLSRERCIEIAAEAKTIPAPADLAERAREMHLAGLERHYGRTRKTIHRWLSEAGITQKAAPPSRGNPALPEARAKAAAKRTSVKAQGRVQWKNPAAPRQVPRPTGLLEEAAQHLRCATRAAIYRCWNTGSANPKGDHWRYGNAVLTSAELIARAERHGFKWRVAA